MGAQTVCVLAYKMRSRGACRSFYRCRARWRLAPPPGGGEPCPAPHAAPSTGL